MTTTLNSKDYKRFKQKAEQLGISEYALAKEGILTVVNEPQDETKKRRMVRVALSFFESGQEIP